MYVSTRVHPAPLGWDSSPAAPRSAPPLTSQRPHFSHCSLICVFLQGRVAKSLLSSWETPGCPPVNTWIVPARPALPGTCTDGRVGRLMVGRWLGLGIRCWLEVEGQLAGRLGICVDATDQRPLGCALPKSLRVCIRLCWGPHKVTVN